MLPLIWGCLCCCEANLGGLGASYQFLENIEDQETS